VSIAAQVRAYLRESEPYNGEKIEGYEITIDPQDMRVIGPPPEYLNITATLLEIGAQWMSFSDGVLVLNLLPKDLHYKPLYWGEYDMIAFERIDA
jgi:hypothetical protein